MFRDLYKQANDDIKGDRVILDKAFVMASQPVKKKNPVFRYSFVGTAVAAVIVLGAVFANPSVFTDKTEELRNVGVEPVTETEITGKLTKEVATEAQAVVTSENTIEATKPKHTTNNTYSEDKKANTEEEQEEDSADDGIMTASIMDEDAFEPASETAGITAWGRREFDEPASESGEGVSDYNSEREDEPFSGGGNGGADVDAEAATEAASETEADVKVETFSYMQHVSLYDAGEENVKTEGFVNTEISPVENAEKAIERAKAECTVEYDTVNVYYDPIEKIWMVNFAMSISGGDESVYINSNGVTQLIVYGE